MRRAVRRWCLGLPSGREAPVGGRPCQSWLNLFVLTHRPCTDGWQRLEWPDGGPLLEQSWLLVSVFQIIASELAAIAREQIKRGRGRSG